MAALRHGIAPAAVIGWSALDGHTWCEPVTAAALTAAADRAGAALDRLAEIHRGRAPARTACRACAWCPEREPCPAARATGDDE